MTLPLTERNRTSEKSASLGSSVEREVVTAPALNVGEPYVSRLSSRASLYADLRRLVDAVPRPLSRSEYRRLVVEENLLVRRTFSAREMAWKYVAARYGMDASSPLFAIFVDEYRRATSENDRSLTAYLLFALRDRLVCDLGTDWLCQYLQTAPAELRSRDVFSFLKAREAVHPEVLKWSASSRENLVSHYFSALKEFGLARGSMRKLTVRPAPGAAPVRFLLRVLVSSGVGSLGAVQSPLFKLLGLTLEETVTVLFRLSAEGSLRCRIQGDVVDLDLGVELES